MEHATKHFRKRSAILSCVRGTTVHPSAEMVHEMLQQEHVLFLQGMGGIGKSELAALL